MNERIKLLAEQAGAKIYTEQTRSGDTVDFLEYAGFDLEKFAELIVRECAKFLDENSGYDESNNAWHPEPEDLLQHFGVEE